MLVAVTDWFQFVGATTLVSSSVLHYVVPNSNEISSVMWKLCEQPGNRAFGKL